MLRYKPNGFHQMLYPTDHKQVRGRGLMIGLEFDEPIKEIRTRLLKEQHVFTGVSGTNVIRLLPPLCLSMDEANEFLNRFRKLFA